MTSQNTRQAIKTSREVAALPDPKPGKKAGKPDEIVDTEDSAVVNSEAQDDVLNGQEPGIPPTVPENDETGDKSRGYAEGTRNDSLTEPEYRGSDDQPGFPGEEGK